MKRSGGSWAPRGRGGWRRSTSNASPSASSRSCRERGPRVQHSALHLRRGPPLLGRGVVAGGERARLRPPHGGSRPQLHARRHDPGADRSTDGDGDRPRRAQADRRRDRGRALRPCGPERRRALSRAGADDGEPRDRRVGAPRAEARRRPALAGPRGGGPHALRRLPGGLMVELTRVYHFSAAHQLANPTLSPERNAALYGDCHRRHGHNYYLEVTVAGRPDPVTGMAVDLGRLDDTVNGAGLAPVDHRSLEEGPALRGVITTGESLPRAVWRILAPALPTRCLQPVAVGGAAENRVEYEGGVG